jgi:hypothetical protein
MKCSDCHNNDTGPVAGGTGPKGPHGSNNPTLLVKPYARSTRPTAADVCYLCHNNSVLTVGNGATYCGVSSTSLFDGDNGHTLHVGDRGFPCSNCHDPHGVSTTGLSTSGGTVNNNSRLINFDTTTRVVSPYSGVLRWTMAAGATAATCQLTCHGQIHLPTCTYAGGNCN